MLDLTTIILTKNEEKHIGRCLKRLSGFGKRVIVVDSGSNDNTCAIAKEHGAEVIFHQWPGNQAAQFNWVLDNVEITTEWVLRLDADEYLSEELKDEITEAVPNCGKDVAAVGLPRGRYFMGRKLRDGGNVVIITRLFRKGMARYEKRVMDEHLVIEDGRTIVLKNKFYDDNRLPLKDFVLKHEDYASREASILLADEYGLVCEPQGRHGDAVESKRSQKARYGRLPLFWRAMGYFCYRYFFKLGFLDGKVGFVWCFMQGWWYRTLVDAKVLEVKRACGDDVDKIKEYLRREYGIAL